MDPIACRRKEGRRVSLLKQCLALKVLMRGPIFDHMNRMKTTSRYNCPHRPHLKPLKLIGLLLLSGLGAWVLAACAITPDAPTGKGGETGLASYYADRFHGRTTASGERYDRHVFTAAHRHYAFGTRVRVTRVDNGRAVEVRINDRGPFVKGRVIDLSYAAARKIGMLQDGVIAVRVVPID